MTTSRHDKNQKDTREQIYQRIQSLPAEPMVRPYRNAALLPLRHILYQDPLYLLLVE